MREAARYCNHLTLRHNLQQHPAAEESLLQRALDDKLTRTRDRLYRLLGLLQPSEDFAAVRDAIEHGDSRRRAAALEYLDNILGGAVRKRVMPLLDDTPVAEKVRHANQALSTRPRGVEDTLAQLVHDDDQVVAAAAVQFVAAQRLWALADDLTFAAGRASRDRRWVNEAASWALRRRAHGDAPDRERQLAAGGRTGRPACGRCPCSRSSAVDELFRLAEAGQEIRYAGRPEPHDGSARGRTSTCCSTAPSGSATGRAPNRGQRRRRCSAPGMSCEAPRSRSDAHATTPVVALRIGAADFLTMVSDNALLAQGLFHTLLAPVEHAVAHARGTAAGRRERQRRRGGGPWTRRCCCGGIRSSRTRARRS